MDTWLKRNVGVLACCLVIGCKGTSDSSAAPDPTERLVERFKACWLSYDAARWRELESCYAPDATIDYLRMNERRLDVAGMIAEARLERAAYPGRRRDLELVIGADTTVIVVVRVTDVGATTSHLARILEFDARGRIGHETTYFSEVGAGRALPIGGPRTTQVVIGQGTDLERANVKTASALIDIWEHERHIEMLDNVLADDLRWSEPGLSQDLDKKGLIRHLHRTWDAFDDYDFEGGASWFAGNHVVADLKVDGRNVGALPALGISEPTYKTFSIPVLAVFKVEQQKVNGAAIFWNAAALYAQLGVVPPASPTSE